MICKECSSEHLVFSGPFFHMLHGECQDCGTWTSELIADAKEEESSNE